MYLPIAKAKNGPKRRLILFELEAVKRFVRAAGGDPCDGRRERTAQPGPRVYEDMDIVCGFRGMEVVARPSCDRGCDIKILAPRAQKAVAVADRTAALWLQREEAYGR